MRPLLLLLALLTPARLSAAGRLAVLPLAGPLDASATAVRQSLCQLLSARGYPALPLPRTDQLLLATDLSCHLAGCLARSARLLRARLLIGGRLEQQGARLSLALWVFDAQQGTTVATSFASGQAGAAGESITVRALEQLLAAWHGASPARLRVSSSPSGATLSVDGNARGVTPLALAVAPGEHSLALQLPGHRLLHRPLRLQPGQLLSLQLTLARLQPPRRTGFLKWTLAGAALAALSVGAGLWSSGRSEPPADGTEPRSLVDHRPPGIGLVAGGAALAAAAGFCFWLEARTARRDRLAFKGGF